MKDELRGSGYFVGVFLIVGLTAVAALIAPAAAAIVHDPVWIDATGDGAFTPGEWNGTSIQAAVANATTGQTIYVEDGTYSENVLVYKSVTLKNASQPVVDALGGTGFNITVENVTIDGFNITNCSYGINSTALGFTL
jgi:nitrous oxidase accessory protein NosD